MGVELGLAGLMKFASIASAGMSVVSGIQGMKAGNEQADLAMQQANMQGVEQERLAQREARMVQEEADATERKQKIAYLKSGVSLEGSPLLVMEETRQKGADNVAEVLAGGKAASSAAQMEGRITAKRAKASGRQAFVSGLSNAASTGMNYAGSLS